MVDLGSIFPALVHLMLGNWLRSGFYHAAWLSLRCKYYNYVTRQQYIFADVHAFVRSGHSDVQQVYPKKGAFNLLLYDCDRRVDTITICALE